MARHSGSSAQLLALEWGIKLSLVKYIEGMPDGSIEVAAPASTGEGGFRFPAAPPPAAPPPAAPPPAALSPATPSLATPPPPHDGILRFAGSVTLTGHGGMLKLMFTDPWLVPGADHSGQWSLTIADPYEPGARIAFATIDQLAWGDGGATAHGTRLTADGADLFFSGPYSEGTELDDPKTLDLA